MLKIGAGARNNMGPFAVRGTIGIGDQCEDVVDLFTVVRRIGIGRLQQFLLQGNAR